MGLLEGHFVLMLFQPHAQQMGGLKSPKLLAQPAVPVAWLGQQESCTQTLPLGVFGLQ